MQYLLEYFDFGYQILTLIDYFGGDTKTKFSVADLVK